MKKRSKKQQKTDLIADIIIKHYEEYLLESEDKQTSDIREDAFIKGFSRGVNFAVEIHTLSKESTEETL